MRIGLNVWLACALVIIRLHPSKQFQKPLNHIGQKSGIGDQPPAFRRCQPLHRCQTSWLDFKQQRVRRMNRHELPPKEKDFEIL